MKEWVFFVVCGFFFSCQVIFDLLRELRVCVGETEPRVSQAGLELTE